MDDIEVHRPDWVTGGPAHTDPLVDNEWLVTNGLGGYSSSSIGGVMTRKYHGYLVAALPAPLGRIVMLQNLYASVRVGDGPEVALSGRERVGEEVDVPARRTLRDFRLELGLPVWEYEVEGVHIEVRVSMPYGQNTVHVSYRRTDDTSAECTLLLRPFVHFRSYESAVSSLHAQVRVVDAGAGRVELCGGDTLPPLRLGAAGAAATFSADERTMAEVVYRVERDRGYEWSGAVWSPGTFALPLARDHDATLVASTERWDVMDALTPAAARNAEVARRRELLRIAGAVGRDPVTARLTLAADQFIISPAGRVEDAARARAEGDEARTVIAGYHWFTDWGRDTMISLEGLTLCTGRHREAGYILRTFAHHVRDGLIPNMFPDGASEGLYHTADATLWFFHALHRYLRATGNRQLLRALLPTLRDIVARHVAGTNFGIHADPSDHLLVQGAEGYQLTWMDAKVDGWVVTPRRGKAVEINALWYNALRLLERWLREEGDASDSRHIGAYADRVQQCFNDRFWYAEGGYLYDVIDGEDGHDDTACRPNQIFAIALDHPVLHDSRWSSVLDVVRAELLTPVGLRSLSPAHPDYKPGYAGDLRTRDSAYHQGTVWGWLIGPFVDAWLRVHPNDREGARQFLDGLADHLDAYGVGSLAEIFDAEAPFRPRGCIAQAWSVAELLRVWRRTSE